MTENMNNTERIAKKKKNRREKKLISISCNPETILTFWNIPPSIFYGYFTNIRLCEQVLT